MDKHRNPSQIGTKSPPASVDLSTTETKREKLAREMQRGYKAEAEDSSLDPAWDALEIEGWNQETSPSSP